jgi:hypothetical protein
MTLAWRVCGCGRTYSTKDQHARCWKCRRAGRNRAPGSVRRCTCGAAILRPDAGYCDPCRYRIRVDVLDRNLKREPSLPSDVSDDDELDLTTEKIEEMLERNHRRFRPGWKVPQGNPCDTPQS